MEKVMCDIIPAIRIHHVPIRSETIIKTVPSMYHSWIMWLLIKGDNVNLWRDATAADSKIF